MFTTFTITVISEVMKSIIIQNYHYSDVVKFYTSMYMLKKKIEKIRKEKEKKESWMFVLNQRCKVM